MEALPLQVSPAIQSSSLIAKACHRDPIPSGSVADCREARFSEPTRAGRSSLQGQIDPFPLLFLVSDAIAIYCRLILLGPPHEWCESLGERTSQCCSRVFDARRNGRIRLPLNQAVPVQAVEGLAQHAGRDALDRSFQFTEAMRPSKQRFDD